MILVRVKVDVVQLEGRVRNAPKRIAFAVTNAINFVLKLAQRAMVLQAGDVFTLRAKSKQFVERNVAIIKPFASATQNRPFGEISVGQKSRLLLPIFEHGGARLPFKGKSVAVPVAARPSKSASVPESLWISRLGLRRQPATTKATRRTRRMGTTGKTWVGRLGTYLVPKVGVFQRIGSIARTLYVFARGTPQLRPVLKFVATVQGVANRNFAAKLRDEVAKALAFRR